MTSSVPNPYVSLIPTVAHRIPVNTTLDVPPTELAALREVMSAYPEVYCEIGSGSGAHLIERARRDPKALYIGIELRYKRAYRTVLKAERDGVENLYVLRTDAKHLLTLFPEKRLSGIYVNFPDPWDKRRWHKNRMMSQQFFENALKLLREGGYVSYKTDHQEYFESTIALLETLPNFEITEVTRDLYGSEYLDDNVPTEFERLFRSKGLPIYFLKAHPK